MNPRLWIVEIEVGSKPSHMDNLIRGRVSPGPIKGSLTSREPVCEEYPSVGQHRDEAIGFFRKSTGWRGAVSVRLARSPSEAERCLGNVVRGRGLRLRFLEQERVDELLSAIEKAL